MNTYLIPIADIDNDEVWIEKIIANNITEAEDKFIQHIKENNEWITSDNIDDLIQECYVNCMIIGDFYDIEEF